MVDGDGDLVGVISQTDLLRARATEHLWANWPGLAVRHLMTSPAIHVRRLDCAIDGGGPAHGARARSTGSWS